MSQNVESYTLIPASIHDFYLSELWNCISAPRMKILDSVRLSLILMFSAQRHGENSIVLKAMERERKRAVLIHQDNLCGKSAMAAPQLQC